MIDIVIDKHMKFKAMKTMKHKHICMSFLSSNQAYTLTVTGVCNLMDHSKIKKNRSFTVTEFHLDTSACNITVHIEINKI